MEQFRGTLLLIAGTTTALAATIALFDGHVTPAILGFVCSALSFFLLVQMENRPGSAHGQVGPHD